MASGSIMRFSGNYKNYPFLSFVNGTDDCVSVSLSVGYQPLTIEKNLISQVKTSFSKHQETSFGSYSAGAIYALTHHSKSLDVSFKTP
jgi:hypothetical protein